MTKKQKQKINWKRIAKYQTKRAEQRERDFDFFVRRRWNFLIEETKKNKGIKKTALYKSYYADLKAETLFLWLNTNGIAKDFTEYIVLERGENKNDKKR